MGWNGPFKRSHILFFFLSGWRMKQIGRRLLGSVLVLMRRDRGGLVDRMVVLTGEREESAGGLRESVHGRRPCSVTVVSGTEGAHGRSRGLSNDRLLGGGDP